jgi:hypothetical protein
MLHDEPLYVDEVVNERQFCALGARSGVEYKAKAMFSVDQYAHTRPHLIVCCTCISLL